MHTGNKNTITKKLGSGWTWWHTVHHHIERLRRGSESEAVLDHIVRFCLESSMMMMVK